MKELRVSNEGDILKSGFSIEMFLEVRTQDTYLTVAKVNFTLTNKIFHKHDQVFK